MKYRIGQLNTVLIKNVLNLPNNTNIPQNVRGNIPDPPPFLRDCTLRLPCFHSRSNIPTLSSSVSTPLVRFLWGLITFLRKFFQCRLHNVFYVSSLIKLGLNYMVGTLLNATLLWRTYYIGIIHVRSFYFWLQSTIEYINNRCQFKCFRVIL